jgi:ribosomal protein S18 acetylase RimI-like enzyme
LVSQKHAFKGNAKIRFVAYDDKTAETQVAELAGRSFKFSRFHRDENFPAGIADKIKAGWARNFFIGKRGECMIVADSDDGIKGFLQLLREGTRTLVIDLIAVDEGARHKGIASDMITFAEQNCGEMEWMRVGTQITNEPSMMMYEKLGFKQMVSCEKAVFHYHSPEMRKR